MRILPNLSFTGILAQIKIYQPRTWIWDLIRNSGCLHFGSVSLTDEPARSATFLAAREARGAGVLVSFDVNYRPSLWKDPQEALNQTRMIIPEVGLIKLNELEAALLTDQPGLDPQDLDQVERAGIKLLELGPAIVVITLGAQGSYFQIADGGAYVPGFKVDTVDAVGCGDAFVAGLLSRLVSGEDWREQLTVERMTKNLRFANGVGALTSLKRGAIPALPYLAEVEDFLKNHLRRFMDKQIITRLEDLKEIARKLRLDILEMTTRAGSGHPSSSWSAVEIVTALYFGGVLNYQPDQPWWEDRDRFIMSKGHAAPLLYAALAEAGYFERQELARLREVGSPVQGHPIQGMMPGVEATTGSLGQGLSLGIGHVLGGRLAGKKYHVYVLLGDGECEAGQIWEAAMAAAHFKIGNLIAILDYNKYQETGPISREIALEPLAEKWKSFGWTVHEVNGHDLGELLEKFQLAKQLEATVKPQIIIAHTIKGKGVSFVEADFKFHGMALTEKQAELAREEINAAR